MLLAQHAHKKDETNKTKTINDYWGAKRAHCL